MLFEEGADPAMTDKMGCTPLHAVAHYGVTDMLHNKAPATLNLTSTDGATPPFIACVNGHESMVSRLLSLGAMQQPDDISISPLIMAAARDFEGVVRILLDYGLEAVGLRSSLPFAVLGAIWSCNAKILRLLLAVDGEEKRPQWANTRCQDSTMLHVAAGMNCPALVNLLLAAGADEAGRDSKGCIAPDVVGLSLIEGVQNDPEKELAIRRMLEQGPAYRARSWSWPAEKKPMAAVAATIAPSPRLRQQHQKSLWVCESSSRRTVVFLP